MCQRQVEGLILCITVAGAWFNYGQNVTLQRQGRKSVKNVSGMTSYWVCVAKVQLKMLWCV